MTYKLGAHLSTVGGYNNALNKLQGIGGNCLQIFSSSPRAWNFYMPDDVSIQQFVDLKNQQNISHAYFHASYLINLANTYDLAVTSRKAIIKDLTLANKMGIRGTIVHTGAFKDGRKDMQTYTLPYENFDPYEDVIINITTILNNTPSDTVLILENAGNKKIGKDLAELSKIIDSVNNPRLRVCLDTCHLYSAGYDFSTDEKLNDFILAFDTLIGLDKLEVIHLNDSKDPFNSGRDRHENIGQGTLGIDTFRLILNHPKLKDKPFILEVPGADDQGPDKENLDILKSLITL